MSVRRLHEEWGKENPIPETTVGTAVSHISFALDLLCALQIEDAKQKGWVANTHGEELMLIVTELAEAMEEIRNHKDVADLYYEGEKPMGVPSELADVVIRVAGFCALRGIDLGAAVAAKLAYNKTRSYKHGGKLL